VSDAVLCFGKPLCRRFGWKKGFEEPWMFPVDTSWFLIA
jgi:hypothetical protein